MLATAAAGRCRTSTGRMGGMDNRRSDGGGVVIGCLVLTILFATLAIGGSAWFYYVRTQAQIELETERALNAAERARLLQAMHAQMSAGFDPKDESTQQETAQPEVK